MLIRKARLADQDAVLPTPGSPGLPAPKGVFEVHVLDPFWSVCIADGSVILVEDEEPPEPSSKKPAKS